MPIDLTTLSRDIRPQNTVLVFGAGSSMPSGAPSARELSAAIGIQFNIAVDDGLTLADVTTLIDKRHGRPALVGGLRDRIARLKPSGGLLTLPSFDWAAIYTTNFDTLIEQVYGRQKKILSVYASNYDFSNRGSQTNCSLFKIHGSIDKDIVDGHNARLTITADDYDQTGNYRELLYNKLRDHLGTHDVIIVGHSLADPDLRSLIEEAQRLKSRSGAPGRIYLFMYARNDALASVYEGRGLEVCFAGLDEFMAAMLANSPAAQLILSVTNELLDSAPAVYPSTVDVSAAIAAQTADLNKMFNGRPASYADIKRGWTFRRAISARLETQLAAADKRIAYIIGTAGVGKTTAVRQTLARLLDRDIRCFEHRPDFDLPVDAWASVDRELRKRAQTAVLFIDDAHEHLREINRLAEIICTQKTPALKLVLASSRPHWNPRLKSPVLFSHGTDYRLSQLDPAEITSLLELLDARPEIIALVEQQFQGFSREVRRRRLVERCRADMFVCLKHIFGFQSIDTIILQEFADLTEDYQEIYRQIAAMETAGVRVHRQLVIRTVGIEGRNVSRILDDLDGIVDEYTIDIRNGVYGWSLRHPVIARLIAKYKYASIDEFYDLLDRIISNLNPAYPIEVKSIEEMCDAQAGIGRVRDKSKQNILLRKMISLAPHIRVCRHRLITNLIELENFEAAETEIRVFEKELRSDGPVQRYKVRLHLRIAETTPGILATDRAAMCHDAAALAEAGVERFPDDKNMYRSYIEAGIAHFRYSRSLEIFNDAMAKARRAQDRILDPDLQRIISHFDKYAERNFGLRVSASLLS